MSDATPFGFGKFVPGFDFLQNLTKGAPSGIPQMPNISSWVAPTVSVEELEKRIEELKAVQFWLDQNSRALTATVQALEVQKMTLATLKGLNVHMADVANAFKVKTSEVAAGGAHKAGSGFAQAAEAMSSAASRAADMARPAPAPERAAAPEPAAAEPAASAVPADSITTGSKADSAGKGEPTAGGLIDPMQWWGSLTQQFQQIAGAALKDAAQQAALDSTRNMAKEAMKTASGIAEKMTAQGVKTMRGTQSAATGGATQARSPVSAATPKKAAAPRKGAAKRVVKRVTKKAASGPSGAASKPSASSAASSATAKKPAVKKPATKKTAAKKSAPKKSSAPKRAA